MCNLCWFVIMCYVCCEVGFGKILCFNDSVGGDFVWCCFYDFCFFLFLRIIMFGCFMFIEGKFFEYFNQYVECVVKVVYVFKELVNDLFNVEMYVCNVQNFEKKVDCIMYDMIELLYKIFIILFDCDEIYKLIMMMDDIFDLMEDVLFIILLYDVINLMDELCQFVMICVVCCEEVCKVVVLFNDMNNGCQIFIIVQEID